MNFSFKHLLFLLSLLTLSTQVNAELVTLEGNALVFSYDINNVSGMGNIEIIGDQLRLLPNLSVSIESQTSDYTPTTVQAYAGPYSAVIDVQAKPGYRIDSHQITTRSYYSRGNIAPETIASISPSSTPFPRLTITGELLLSSTGYYVYDAPGPLREEPVYGYETISDIIGYDPVYDASGNVIDQIPIYDIRQIEVIIGYNVIETFFPVYRIDSESLGISDITVDFQVSAVPIPPSAWLFLSGLAISSLSILRRQKLVDIS